MTTIKVALVGQPNVGKSALINSVGNARLRVGNFSGVTVKKQVVRFSRDGYNFEITDLPGTYSLADYTIEERVTKHYLDENDYDIILNVIDSTNIERNLYLTTELLALNKKTVVALNMTDEAIKEGVHIDEQQLGKLLGAPCVKTSAVQKTGMEAVIQAVIQVYNKPVNKMHLQFSEPFEEEIERIVGFLQEKKLPWQFSFKALAIKLLREDHETFRRFHELPVWIELQPIIHQAYQHLYLHYDTRDLDDIFNDEKIALAKGAVAETVHFDSDIRLSLTDRVDALLIHQVVGLPIFLLLMWGLFQLTFVLGSIPMDWIDAFFVLLINGSKSFLGDTELASAIADGAIAGVGAVVMFLPNIVILFLGIALLETTGYMSRVAFLLDGFFHRFGLHGKSFIPLVTGFGCSVPAYMAARTLKNDRDRMLTLFIIGFMSCGARLPIYVLFVGAFFSKQQAGNMLFLIYVSGAILGIMAAKILKMTAFKGQDEPFVMEMPKYRMPSMRLIWHTVSGQASMYLRKAGTYILLASVLIWFAGNYPKHPELEQHYQTQIAQAVDGQDIARLSNELAMYNLEHSYLGIIGHASEVFFAPLGYDWRMAVALETGLAAKEVVVATLGVLYGLGEEVGAESAGLIEKIHANISFPAAVSFVVFVMIYLPCLAASMVFVREAGGWKYLGYLFLFTTVTAWTMSFLAFNITRALT